MFDRERTLYAFVLHYARLLAGDIDDSVMADQPAPGLNHPAWILGHLAICTDYALKCLGEPPLCPESWHEMFGPGSSPEADRSRYPSREESSLSALARGHEAVVGALPRATPEAMGRPHDIPMTFLQELLPTVGDLLAH